VKKTSVTFFSKVFDNALPSKSFYKKCIIVAVGALPTFTRFDTRTRPSLNSRAPYHNKRGARRSLRARLTPVLWGSSLPLYIAPGTGGSVNRLIGLSVNRLIFCGIVCGLAWGRGPVA
jgi:hypothetical protein